MDFGNFREMSVKTGKDRKLKKVSNAFKKNAGCFTSAVVIIMTADGKHLAFSGRHRKLFFISDLYRSLPTSHGDCRSPLYPCYVKGQLLIMQWKAAFLCKYFVSMIIQDSVLFHFLKDLVLLTF